MKAISSFFHRCSLYFIFTISILLLLSIPVISDIAEFESAAAQVSVEKVVIEPTIPFEDDIITVTIMIRNTGTRSVAISRANMYSKDLMIMNQGTYNTVGSIGAGNTMEFTYLLRANARDGIYYLWFNLDFRDAGSLQYHIPVTISNTPIVVSIIDMPTVFHQNGEETIVISVGNPRENTLNGVSVQISGENIASKQNSRFIGTLASDESREVSFDITAREETDLLITTTYRTGTNAHTHELSIPIEVGIGGKSASLVINNVELDSGDLGYHRISGDVNNAGLKTAEAVVITTTDPAGPVEPYRNYVIGSLNPDDFSSFDLTFTADDMSHIPVLVTYKDKSGNNFSEEFTLDLSYAFDANTASKFTDSFQVMWVVLIVIIGFGLFIAWKRGYGPFKAVDERK